MRLLLTVPIPDRPVSHRRLRVPQCGTYLPGNNLIDSWVFLSAVVCGTAAAVSLVIMTPQMNEICIQRW